jgi:hypothetical protein
MRFGVSVLVRQQADPHELRRSARVFHHGREVRRRFAERPGFCESRAKPGRSEDDGCFDFSYIDEKANAEQRKALEEISWAIQPPSSKTVSVRFVPITRVIEGKNHKITIGEYGTFTGHLMESVMGGAPKITNAPGADPIRTQFEQGQTSAFQYKDESQDWNSTGSNYMYTNFETDSEQYEKFGTMMMHMMEQSKKGEAASEHKH